MDAYVAIPYTGRILLFAGTSIGSTVEGVHKCLMGMHATLADIRCVRVCFHNCDLISLFVHTDQKHPQCA